MTFHVLTFFLILALLVFVSGAGVSPHLYLYTGFVVFVFAASKCLGKMLPWLRLPFLLFWSSTLLALLVSDLVCRKALDYKLFYRSHDKYFELSPEFKGRYRYTPNINSIRTISGDLAAMSGDASLAEFRPEWFITDERGFRNEQIAEGMPIDILVLGDSYGTGADTTQESTWAVLLQQKLGKVLYNLSLPGSPADELFVLESELPHLRLSSNPVLIWMLFSGNDLVASYENLKSLGTDFRLNPLESLVVHIQNFQSRSPISKMVRGLTSVDQKFVKRKPFKGLGDVLFYRPHDERAVLSAEQLRQLPQWEQLVASFEQMSKVATRLGLTVFVVVAPSKEAVYLHPEERESHDPLAIALQDLCLRFSFDCFDLKPPLAREAFESSKLLWWRDDTHWNIEGNRIVSELLFAQLNGRIR